MRFDTNNIPFQEIQHEMLEKQGVKMVMCRLDLLHPVVSGNKLFKLFYFLEAALEADHKTILTFGGAWSNHLVATAYACKERGLKSIGIVRGERPADLSHTLAQCYLYGMQLHFISRHDYKNAHLPEFARKLEAEFGAFTLIPEGGFHPLGAKGAALIMDAGEYRSATHICTSAGTATTLAGLIMGSTPEQEIVVFPAIKNMQDIPERIRLLTDNEIPERVKVADEYHFGGYAKRTPGLIGFMNEFYSMFRIPTDIIYTSKMMYGVWDKLKQGYFKPGSIVVCLHTGGLQGNSSLPKDALIF